MAVLECYHDIVPSQVRNTFTSPVHVQACAESDKGFVHVILQLATSSNNCCLNKTEIATIGYSDIGGTELRIPTES